MGCRQSKSGVGVKPSDDTLKFSTGSKPASALEEALSTSRSEEESPRMGEKSEPETSQLRRIFSESERQDSAKIIQKFARKTLAKYLAAEELQWKIFSELDALEEAEMMKLARFMEVLLEKVPSSVTSPIEDVAISITPSMDPDHDRDDKQPPPLQLRRLSLDTVNLTSASSSPRVCDGVFDFGSGKCNGISSRHVCEMIEMLRSGGKFSPESVLQLLRKSYVRLKQSKVLLKIDVPSNGKLTVVGDLHGNILDLIHILDEAGLPSASNFYVFNGDFVDRGESGAEVVCLLFALFVCWPDFVILQKGNHEDGQITRVYGFYDECLKKYDETTYEVFVEVFRHLPVFTVINDAVLVVHGGLFHDRSVTLEMLNQIDRCNFIGEPRVPYPDCLVGLDKDAAYKEFLFQLMRDALWSDAHDTPGIHPNPRGAGIQFGPDVTQEFMDNNGLSMIIRSHECVRQGFFLPFSNTAKPSAHRTRSPLLCTVFSASNYCNHGNEAAYLVLMPHAHSSSSPVKKTGLHYSVRHFKTTPSSVIGSIEASNKSSLMDLILKKRDALSLGFESADAENTGSVSRNKWAEVMREVTGIRVRWLAFIDSLVPATCMIKGGLVHYRLFLKKYSIQLTGGDSNAVQPIMDILYSQRKRLEIAFNFFDTNKDGMISKEEFREGCRYINQELPMGKQLQDVDHLLELMDVDGNGFIDINEFFEAFRISEERIISSGEL